MPKEIDSGTPSSNAPSTIAFPLVCRIALKGFSFIMPSTEKMNYKITSNEYNSTCKNPIITASNPPYLNASSIKPIVSAYHNT